MMLSKNKLKCRKAPSVLPFFTPNKNRNFELHVHHVLMLDLPFRRELSLKVVNRPSYTNKLGEPDIAEIVNQNRNKIELYSELVENAFNSLKYGTY